LRAYGIAVVSLYPGLLRTEAVLAAGAFDLSNSESPQFIWRVVAALARDPAVLERSGTVVIAAAAASDYGLTDTDGRWPPPLTLADVKACPQVPPNPVLNWTGARCPDCERAAAPRCW